MRLLLAVLTTLLAIVSPAFSNDAEEIFEKRLRPILDSPDPSSCSACHLGGVDLKSYLGKNARETFAALREQGLISLEDPPKSRLLQFIERRPAQSTPVLERVREAELKAFRDWITACASDPGYRMAKASGPVLGPSIDDEVIRHGRLDPVIRRFEELIWSEVERCAACHSPQKNQKQVVKHGEQISWIVPGNPAATLQKIVDHKLIDLDNPRESLLLRKPTNQVDHGGGIKLMVNDRTYSRFRSFLEDYSAIVRGRYQHPADLPQASSELIAATDVWLKLTGLPADLQGRLVVCEIFPADGSGGWSKTPAAVGERLFYPGSEIWQQHLSLVAKRGTTRAQEIHAPRKDVARLLPPADIGSWLMPTGKADWRLTQNVGGKIQTDWLTSKSQPAGDRVTTRWKSSPCPSPRILDRYGLGSGGRMCSAGSTGWRDREASHFAAGCTDGGAAAGAGVEGPAFAVANCGDDAERAAGGGAITVRDAGAAAIWVTGDGAAAAGAVDFRGLAASEKGRRGFFPGVADGMGAGWLFVRLAPGG